ncbi:MAG: hypothetical protein ACRD3J_07505, partial [Thermoanaerobaculia bacterium]
MTQDIFAERRKAFEEEHFRKQDEQLVDKLKTVFRRKIDREALRTTTGITDDRVLDNLVNLNLNGEMMAAFKLYPLIEVAWADGSADEREIRAVLASAEHDGVKPGSAPYVLLENALKNGPRDESRKAWYM